jgi:pyruvate decarboxylase
MPFSTAEIMNWDYCGLVRSMQNQPIAGQAAVSNLASSKLFTARAETEGQLAEAIAAATAPDRADHLAFIEVILDTDDVTKELLEFGARVAHANSRKPSPQ